MATWAMFSRKILFGVGIDDVVRDPQIDGHQEIAGAHRHAVRIARLRDRCGNRSCGRPRRPPIPWPARESSPWFPDGGSPAACRCSRRDRRGTSCWSCRRRAGWSAGNVGMKRRNTPPLLAAGSPISGWSMPFSQTRSAGMSAGFADFQIIAEAETELPFLLVVAQRLRRGSAAVSLAVPSRVGQFAPRCGRPPCRWLPAGSCSQLAM